jgi:RNA polymerase sigma-70 factor (ECF subfamily)
MDAAHANPLGAGLLREKYAESRAVDYGLSEQAFVEILRGIETKYCKSPTEVDALWRSLRFEELALARGCAAGNDTAWTVFLSRYRAHLYDSAHSITRDDAAARELADSLYAELYGMDLREGVRRSKLEHYSGRGSLEGWLRTVLAQEWVNRFRKVKREISLDEQEEAGVQFAAPQPDGNAVPQQSAALKSATELAIGELSSEDKYILASYHLDGRKLAEIGKVLGVHESTISRKVERISAQVRAGILKHLEKQGLSRRQAEEALEADVRDVDIDVRGNFAQHSARDLQAGAKQAFSKGEQR